MDLCDARYNVHNTHQAKTHSELSFIKIMFKSVMSFNITRLNWIEKKCKNFSSLPHFQYKWNIS